MKTKICTDCKIEKSLSDFYTHQNTKDGYRGKHILQYDSQGNFIKEWESVVSAANSLKIKSAEISRVLVGRRKTCRKFIWKYKNV